MFQALFLIKGKFASWNTRTAIFVTPMKVNETNCQEVVR